MISLLADWKGGRERGENEGAREYEGEDERDCCFKNVLPESISVRSYIKRVHLRTITSFV